MATKTTTLTIEITYDDSKTDPESLAVMADRVRETGQLSLGGIEGYGELSFSEFFVLRLPTLNIRELKKLAIKEAMEKHGGSVVKAASELGMGRATLYRKLNGTK